MEQHGNTTTFNLESVLRQNILDSRYYCNTVVTLSSWQEVVDEIYYSVKDCEPWLGGNARGASTAFCLLHRLFELRPTVQEVRNLLDHPDSPYIRAVCLLVLHEGVTDAPTQPVHRKPTMALLTTTTQIGLLYLRYVGNPKQLWEWFLKYIRDPEVCLVWGDGLYVPIALVFLIVFIVHNLTLCAAGISTQWAWTKDHHHWCICS